MKSIKILLILSVFLGFTSIGYCQGNLGSKLNLSGGSPAAISTKANNSPASSISSPYSEFLQDPVINSTLGGMGNMLQNGNTNFNTVNEMSKQQMDYAKQMNEKGD